MYICKKTFLSSFGITKQKQKLQQLSIINVCANIIVLYIWFLFHILWIIMLMVKNELRGG